MKELLEKNGITLYSTKNEEKSRQCLWKMEPYHQNQDVEAVYCPG